ncbi:MAG TPA: hypothetical protein VGL22_00780 [Terracidiphilus sp.]|jgi:hypothetical protein
MRLKVILLFSLLGFALPAFANVTVTTPLSGSTVVSPFTLLASAGACPSQRVVSMGYSLDDSLQTTIVWGTSVAAQVTSPLGHHVLHVKSWGNGGEPCVADVPLNVVDATAPFIPYGAEAVSKIQALPSWQVVKDPGTGAGVAEGTITVLSTTSLTGAARAFTNAYSQSAGARFYTRFGVDRAATNFVYDVWVNIPGTSSAIGAVDFEMNQVIPNGQTVIYGLRCDGATNMWEYTQNAGTPQLYDDAWVESSATCSPSNWTPDTWHHVQASYERNDAGDVTYQSVWLDGAKQDINATVSSAFALGWGSVLLTNLQVDGDGPAGTATVYVDNLSVYRWVSGIDDPLTLVPDTAVTVQNVQSLRAWKGVNDTGVGRGTSAGVTAAIASPSLTGSARQFLTSYSNNGGERYYVSFGSDTQAHNFVYDGWVYLAAPSAGLANLELDMNQVLDNGETVIYGIQCDGSTGTWDYTENAGTVQNYVDHWLHSKAACNPRDWTADTWHRVQFAYSRDDAGNVTYKAVWLDGVEQDLNVTVPSSFALGWGSVLLTNFQIDGLGGSGAVTAYLDNLNIYRW